MRVCQESTCGTRLGPSVSVETNPVIGLDSQRYVITCEGCCRHNHNGPSAQEDGGDDVGEDLERGVGGRFGFDDSGFEFIEGVGSTGEPRTSERDGVCDEEVSAVGGGCDVGQFYTGLGLTG